MQVNDFVVFVFLNNLIIWKMSNVLMDHIHCICSDIDDNNISNICISLVGKMDVQ